MISGSKKKTEDVTLSPEQESILDAVINEDYSIMIQAGAGTGKCLGKDTPIMLADGSIIPVQDIQEGMRLMGPDSLPRKVLSTTTGYGPMYRITPIKGDSWTCNDVHVLTLKGTNRHMGKIIDLPLNKAIDPSTFGTKRPDKNWKLFRVPVDFTPSPVNPYVDPYLLGTWLGDGTVGVPQWSLGVEKKPIVEYLDDWASNHDILCNIGWNEDHNYFEVRFSMRLRGDKHKPGEEIFKFKENLFSVGVNSKGEKHIHPSYLRNSRAIRLSVLAGLLDTDGSATCGGFDFTTKYVSLRDDVLYLCRSLGLAAYASSKFVRLEGWDSPREYFRISISGDTSDVPFLRHTPYTRKQVKDVLKTGWDVESIGNGEYYGFMLSGDGRFLLGDFTVTHNTFILVRSLRYMSGDVFYGAFNKSIQMEVEKKVGELGIKNCRTVVKTLHAAGLGAYCTGKQKRPQINSDKMYHWAEEAARTDSRYAKYKTFLVKTVSHAKRAGFGVLVEMNDNLIWEDLIEHYSLDDELPGDSEYIFTDTGSLDDLIELCKEMYTFSLANCEKELDFDDMLLAPLYHKSRFSQYDYVLLDEVQDCSAIRQELAVRMLKPGGRMIAVGDRYQNIYGFTGCRHDEMDILRERMHMKEFPLMTTFRCPKVSVAIAQSYVPEYKAAENAPDGIYRHLWLEPENCIYCGGDQGPEPCKYCNGKKQPGFWDEAHTLGPNDSILCRNNKPLVELAYQLLRRSIPCQIEGRDFAAGLIKLCKTWKIKDLNRLETKLQEYKEREMEKWHKKGNAERAASVEDRVDTVLCLLDAVRSQGKSTVMDLIDKITQMFGETLDGQKPRVLTLSTIHKAKGREWDRVYLLGRSRYMPNPWAKKDWELACENVNLPYVMVTRNKRELVELHVPAQQKRRQN